jgi:hypothetical protein
MSSKSDGSTASYYELPAGCTELQDLISHRNLNAQDGEMFRAIYRKGMASHSDALRDAKKVLFYATAEVKRLETASVAVADNDGWIEWEGGTCPADDFAMVDFKMRNGSKVSRRLAYAASWDHFDTGGDIIAYRIHKADK